MATAYVEKKYAEYVLELMGEPDYDPTTIAAQHNKHMREVYRRLRKDSTYRRLHKIENRILRKKLKLIFELESLQRISNSRLPELAFYTFLEHNLVLTNYHTLLETVTSCHNKGVHVIIKYINTTATEAEVDIILDAYWILRQKETSTKAPVSKISKDLSELAELSD